MSIQWTHINLLEHLQLLRLYLGHKELHALFAVLVEQSLGVLVHGGAALTAQSAQDDAEALRTASFHYLLPVIIQKREKEMERMNTQTYGDEEAGETRKQQVNCIHQRTAFSRSVS